MATKIHCTYCNSSQPRLRSLYQVYDFDISREYFVHDPLLPCDFPKLERFYAMEQDDFETSLTPDIVQAGDSDFAGPHYDVEKGGWVEGHILCNGGDLYPAVQGLWLEDISDDLHRAVPNGIDEDCADPILQVIRHVGPAAAKLYLTNPEGNPSYTSSGFCLENRFFLTAAHWSFSEEINNRMCKPRNGLVYVSVAHISKSWQTDARYFVRSAHLIYCDEAADIALFGLDADMSDFPRTLSNTNLRALSGDLSKIEFERIWTIGYAEENKKSFKNYLLEQRKIVPDNLALEIHRNNKEDPSFEGMYHPYNRVLFFGRLGQKHPTEPDVWYHSVPGWFGMSGSMMGVVHYENENWRYSIIGTFKGGVPTEEFNQLKAFTITSLEIIAQKMQAALPSSIPA